MPLLNVMLLPERVVLKNDKFHLLTSSIPVSEPLVELVYIEVRCKSLTQLVFI